MDVKRLLILIAKHDLHYSIHWNYCDEEDELDFYVNCNDAFWWACGDNEDIETNNDIDLLEQCLKDCEDEGTLLYCAKRRGVRPQGALYDSIEEQYHHLFDACGELREVGHSNPYKHPSERTKDDKVYKTHSQRLKDNETEN